LDDQNEESRDHIDQKPLFQPRDIVLKELYSLSGKQIVDRILEHEGPRALIQQLPSEDFLWLIKKVGEDDSLPLLRLASEDQWLYLLDLELWSKDRLNLEHTSRWLGRLQQADPDRLAKWLFSKGEMLTYYYLFKSIQVMMRDSEHDVLDLEDDYFTLDGVFYIKVIDSEQRETIENIIRRMAKEDFDRYQSLLLGLAGVIPAEVEEEMYRLRNVRLSEHGFLPFDEAMSVYAPLDPGAIGSGDAAETINTLFDEESRELAPISPLYYATGRNLLTYAMSRTTDNLFLDRIRLEFAGLCNQIISADGVLSNELEVLIKTCRKAAGCMNLALERLCGTDTASVERLLRSSSLLSIFRVGFGLVLKLRWEIERWLKESWFYGHGLDFSFWGDNWGETLAGLMEKKPVYYVGLERGEEYRDFESLSELNDCRTLMHRAMVLDKLLERLTDLHPLDKRMFLDSQLTFQPLLFNLWARQVLRLEPGFSHISSGQAKEFFGHLRAGARKPPYKMRGFEEIFVKDFMAYTSDLEPEDKATLQDTLCLIWQEFRKEYEWVSMEDMDTRFAKFIWITP
jgi:hypothetical protein